MFRNYFKIAWRNIVKGRFYSAVNIIGLSAGIVFTLIIGAYVWSEKEVNRGLKNADRQYIIQSRWKEENMGIDLTSIGPLAKEMRQRYPDLVANYYRWDGITSNVSKGDKVFREGLQVCDSTMFKMYGFELLHGNPTTAFDGPYSLVITDEKAKKYFGKTDVIGQTIMIENFSGSKHDFIITGVMKSPFKNSVTFLNDNNNNQFYISAANIAYFGRVMETWQNQYIVSYLELQKGADPKKAEALMAHLVKQNCPPQIGANMKPYLVTLKDYYLSANNAVVRKMLYALSGIALFILLMAVINFVNLSVSRSASRLKEIGVRKTLGGLKKQLMSQFLTESVIMVLFATILAVIIAQLTRPFFSSILGKEIPSITAFPLYFIFFPLLLVAVVGLLSGIYPAFVLSSMKSVDSLKGRLTTIGEKVVLRKSLVTLQFATATVVFIGAIIIARQVNLFFSKDLGFNKEYIVSAQVPRNWTKEGVYKIEAIRKQFEDMPEVVAATVSFEVPDGNNSGNVSLYKVGSDSTTAVPSALMMTDEYYANTFKIKMLAGEFYAQPGALTDSSRIVINASNAKALGWSNPQDAIGKKVYFQGFNGPPATIAGVTADFHFDAMRRPIQPITIAHVGVTTTFRMLSLKIAPGNVGKTIDALQKKWSVLLPGTSFEYSFMDDALAKLYTTELQLKKASYTATALSFVIVLLGVLGLVALSIQKRTKEIGIRKVLGSSVTGIISLFMREFLVIVLIAGLVACPLAYIIMRQWLEAYAYRIDMSASPFLVSIGILCLITAILITLQTIRTAIANPVKSLRTE